MSDSLLLSFALGLVIGFVVAWETFIRRERPTLKITVDKEVLSQINGAMIAAWLDQRGLIWMPKGQDFKVGVKLPPLQRGPR